MKRRRSCNDPIMDHVYNLFHKTTDIISQLVAICVDFQSPPSEPMDYKDTTSLVSTRTFFSNNNYYYCKNKIHYAMVSSKSLGSIVCKCVSVFE